MELTKELLAKAKNAKSAEEIMQIAKENGKEITHEQAQKCFEQLHKIGELPDDELDNVSGGVGTDCTYSSNSNYKKFSVGQRVYHIVPSNKGHNKRYGIIDSIDPEMDSFWGINKEWIYNIVDEITLSKCKKSESELYLA